MAHPGHGRVRVQELGHRVAFVTWHSMPSGSVSMQVRWHDRRDASRPASDRFAARSVSAATTSGPGAAHAARSVGLAAVMSGT